MSPAVREGGIAAELVQAAVRIAVTVNDTAAKTPKSRHAGGDSVPVRARHVIPPLLRQ
jgi:hypothetical protein